MAVSFFEDFLAQAREHFTQVLVYEHPFGPLVELECKVVVHLVSLCTQSKPEDFLAIQQVYQVKNILLVHLWQDVWCKQSVLVLNRLRSFCGKNHRVFARKTQVRPLGHLQACQFLTENHLLGYLKQKYHYGLFDSTERLLAVASFSALRLMKSKGAQYRSAELVRFAMAAGVTVVGGLSRLIKHFARHAQPNDIMTYADRDWSLATGLQQVGFQRSSITSPAFFWVDTESCQRFYPHHLPPSITPKLTGLDSHATQTFLQNNGFVQVFNTGNIKMYWYASE